MLSCLYSAHATLAVSQGYRRKALVAPKAKEP